DVAGVSVDSIGAGTDHVALRGCWAPEYAAIAVDVEVNPVGIRQRGEARGVGPEEAALDVHIALDEHLHGPLEPAIDHEAPDRHPGASELDAGRIRDVGRRENDLQDRI